MSKNIELLSLKSFETLEYDSKNVFDINLCSVLIYSVIGLQMIWPSVCTCDKSYFEQTLSVKIRVDF